MDIGNNRFIFVVALFWMVYSILFNSFGFSSSMLASIVVCVLFPFFSIEQKWLFLFSTLPFMGIFKLAGNLPSTSIILYVILIAATLIKGIRLNKNFIVFTLCLTTIQLIVLLVHGGGLVVLISSIINYIFISQSCELFESFGCKKESFFLNATVVYLLSMAIMSFVSQIMPAMASLVSQVDQSIFVENFLSKRYSGLAGDPNYYTQLVMIGLALGVSVFFLTNASLCQKFISLFCCIYLLYSGVFTMSKSYYASVAILFVITFLYIYKLNVNKKSFLIVGIIITPIIMYLGYYILLNFVVPGIYQRVSATVDLTSGRSDIWSVYLNLFASKMDVLFFGAGAGNAKQLILPIYGKAQTAHNMIIEQIADYGLVGCCFMLGMYYKSIKKFFLGLSNPMVIFFVMFLATGMSLSLSSYDAYCFVIPMLCLIDIKKEGFINYENRNIDF